jgi:small glutamine-rich tetratricopeptide repeat-containing protein alpha
VQCISEAFEVDPSNQEQVSKLSVKPTTLPTIFDLFLKTRDKLGTGTSPAPATPTPAAPVVPTAEQKTAAEKLKQEGNGLMTKKEHDKAIDAYTKAIELDSTNPIYFSNRAAAHSSKGDHLSAIGDAEKAIELDPNFTKGYSRLGHAQYSIGDYAAAATAYRRGLELDPTNASLKQGLTNSEQHVQQESSSSTSVQPDTNTGQGMGGLPGMPDIASLMQNPMMMQMAQQMMANGGLDRLMSNPNINNMVYLFNMSLINIGFLTNW